MSARRTVTVEGVTWEYADYGTYSAWTNRLTRKTADLAHHCALNRIAELEAQVERLTAEPIKYDQIENGCWAACIAGITGLDKAALDALVPVLHEGDPGQLWADRKAAQHYNEVAVPEYLIAHGWGLVVLRIPPKGFAIGSGKSPRGVDHAVIVRDGVLWHDPHPSRAGVLAFDDFELLFPLAAEAR